MKARQLGIAASAMAMTTLGLAMRATPANAGGACAG
jgi:hypothetical protein